MEENVSYVANLKIEKVKKRVNQDRGSSTQGATIRDTVETLNLTIKASSLTRLQEKVSAHVSMLDEEDL